MPQTIVQVDSFTNTPYHGNPAGVCLLSAAADDRWMRQVAREMNVSETAFLYPEKDSYHLRWFTPSVEVALCGHATLAAAHVLWEDQHAPVEQELRFSTRSGLLTARKQGEWIELNFPAREPATAEPPAGFVRALGVTPAAILKSIEDFLVEVVTAEQVRAITPDMNYFAKFDGRGLIVTARSDRPEYDFISRFFAPSVGVPEDPATGSAHCTLGPYWARKLGKSSFTAFQASQRGGVLRVTVQGDRVLLGGQAVTVLRGELLG